MLFDLITETIFVGNLFDTTGHLAPDFNPIKFNRLLPKICSRSEKWKLVCKFDSSIMLVTNRPEILIKWNLSSYNRIAEN